MLALVGRTEEPKTWLEKAWGSLKEIGNNIMDASNERYDKRYSSVWGFLDYWTAGIWLFLKNAYHKRFPVLWGKYIINSFASRERCFFRFQILTIPSPITARFEK